MKNKVAIIRGWGNIAPQITSLENCINADNVALITALKYPHTLPEKWAKFQFDPTTVYVCLKEVMDYWNNNDYRYLIASEYASFVLDKGGNSIRFTEGEVLEIDWFYRTVRSYHKHFNQSIVECSVNYFEDHDHMNIDGTKFTLEEGLDRLRLLSVSG